MSGIAREISPHETGLDVFATLQAKSDEILNEIQTRMAEKRPGDNTVPGSLIVFRHLQSDSNITPRNLFALSVLTNGSESGKFLKLSNLLRGFSSKGRVPSILGGAIHVYEGSEEVSHYLMEYHPGDGYVGIQGDISSDDGKNNPVRTFDYVNSDIPLKEMDETQSGLLRVVAPKIETGLFIASLLLDNQDPELTFAEAGFSIPKRLTKAA